MIVAAVSTNVDVKVDKVLEAFNGLDIVHLLAFLVVVLVGTSAYNRHKTLKHERDENKDLRAENKNLIDQLLKEARKK